MPAADIETIVRSWKISGDSDLEKPASAAQIRKVEERLGLSLSEECVALYRLCNGADVLSGNISIYPLYGRKRSLLWAANYFRDYDEPIPPGMVVFAGNGLGGFFGFWPMPDGTTQVIESDGNGSMTVVGTSLARFLRGRSAYYFLGEEADAPLDLLGLPTHLRAPSMLEGGYELMMCWADPGLPEARRSSVLF